MFSLKGFLFIMVIFSCSDLLIPVEEEGKCWETDGNKKQNQFQILTWHFPTACAQMSDSDGMNEIGIMRTYFMSMLVMSIYKNIYKPKQK